MNTTRTRRQRGLTLVEAAITVAVAAVLVGAVAPSFQASIERRRVEGAAAQLETDLQFARSLAVARNQSLRVSFSESGNASCYVIHTGNAGDCVCGSEGPATCSNGAQSLRTVQFGTATRTRVQSNSRSMLFDPQKGTVTPTGTIEVAGAGGASLHEVVNIMGRVRSCSPGSAMPGYRAC